MAVCYLFSNDLSGDSLNRKSLSVELYFFKALVAWLPRAKVECKPDLSETDDIVPLEYLVCVKYLANCFALIVYYNLSKFLS